MKNYLKISIALCLAFGGNNVFAISNNFNNNDLKNKCKSDTVLDGVCVIDHFTNQEGENVQQVTYTLNNNLCYLSKFQSSKYSRNSEPLQKSANDFFGKNVSFVKGILEFTRSTVKSSYGTLVVNNKCKITEDNNENFFKCVLLNGTTLFMSTDSVLEMGSGSSINITQNSKLLISGRTRIEPNCIINVGSKCCTKTGDKGVGGYLIVNALYPIDISNLTINLNNANSHLEIHGNDVRLSGLTIHRFDRKATIHMQCIPLVAEFIPVKELDCTEEDGEPEGENNAGNNEQQNQEGENNGTGDGNQPQEPVDEGDGVGNGEQDPNGEGGDGEQDHNGEGETGEPGNTGSNEHNHTCPCGCNCNKDKVPEGRKPHHHSRSPHSSRKDGKKGPKSECHFPKNTVNYRPGRDECPNNLRARSKYKVDVDVNIKKYHPCKHNNIRKYCANKIDEE